ncbi:unnamed protein product [Brassicogethes aeneus]|uniref:Integrase core domain-containing protein n=1 Tax=Brassicogethes aeneus TaxID=1431903 RepID=A0A9P0BIU1_BRAAE|nr:unnamed protein product [Brassicogethes aeneus]
MTASTVIASFTGAVVQYGLPSRIRSDFGYENLFVAMVMNAIRGLSRGSHLTGRSVHNQRIERLWVDVFKEVVDFFYREFNALEDAGFLNINNLKHLYALQKVYVKFINEKLDFFREAWNCHKIRTAGFKSPRQLWLSGVLQNANSEYTAPSEVLTEQPDLFTRVVEAFDINEREIPAIVPDEEEVTSNLTVDFQLTDDQLAFVDNVLSDNTLDYRSKYLRIAAFLDTLM